MTERDDTLLTAQSTSKPITYTLSLEELGADVVHKYQGREPSGRMFNEIVLDHDGELLCSVKSIITKLLT